MRYSENIKGWLFKIAYPRTQGTYNVKAEVTVKSFEVLKLSNTSSGEHRKNATEVYMYICIYKGTHISVNKVVLNST